MENRRKCLRQMTLMFLLLVGCCFSTVLSSTTLSSNVTNENITSEEPSATTPPVSTNTSSVLPNTNVTSDGPGGTSTVSSEPTDGDLSNTSSTTRQEITTAFSDNTTSSSISTNEHLTSTFPPFNVTTTPDITTCQDISYVDTIYDSNQNWHFYPDDYYWYKMSFWGGHLQIPWKDELDSSCEYGLSWSFFLVLKEKHMDIDDIGEDIITLDACIKNNTEEECVWDVKVEMRKCDGHLLYRFHWDYYNDHIYYYNTYICWDKIYTDAACESSDFVYAAGHVNGSYLNMTYYETKDGWLDAYRDGKQFVIPSFSDVEDVFENCFPKYYHYNRGHFLQEPLSQDLSDVPTRLRLYTVYRNYYGNYDYYQDYEGEYHYEEYSYMYAYARMCDGRVQFDISRNFYYTDHSCFIHYNNVKVTPEIGHIEEPKANGGTLYRPFLQFRCSFEMQSTLTYKVKWYINDTLWMETEPSSDPDDLVFNKEDLNAIPFGYQVKCGVITIGSNGTQESFSDSFYAGWKVSDTSVKLGKNGQAFVEVEQTIPLGCSHTDSGTETCEELLSLIDPHHVEGECEASIHVLNANDSQLSYHKVKGLKRGETWGGDKKYKFKLSTIDNNYDDKLYFDMNVLVTNSMGHRPQMETELINTIKVVVVNSTLHRNKRCYSHADPHMRTADGRYYGQMKEGDHMLYRNEAHQTEVHEYARYCNEWRYAVCACGVTVRSGADVFMINRCGNFTFLDFLHCGDGGIIDVERIHDYRYKVTTPIGTQIIVNLHSWSKTIDIDIYLSAKDFGNIDGLCGYFDGDSRNDFRHRDGSESTVSSGYYYDAFSDSWRLTNEENFLVNEDRLLDKWDQNNGAHPCSRPDSITQNKCKFQRRKRRQAFSRIRKETSLQKLVRNDDLVQRKKRTTYDLADEEAWALCNQSINNAPAVLEFSDKLAGEDQAAVCYQCAYDVVEGNDTAWAEAHVDALNNIAATVINLNPVFAKNNSESIKSFLQQTCLNNCTSRGSCSDAGLCACDDIFRGPDCGIDLRIGPVINDIHGGGLCDTADGDECDCFIIRTDNIFEGFDYKLTTYEVHFDGTTNEIGHQSIHEGEYEDIFTGVVCVPEQRKKRSTDESDSSIQMYDFAISNDGTNFGQSKSVYLYDSTCIDLIDHGGVWTIVLKNNYCYIAGACVEPKTALQTTSGCFLCDSSVSPFGWVKVKCNGDEVGLATATLIAIIASSVSVVIIITAVLVYVRCIKGSKKRRAVEDIQSSQAYLSSGPSREKWVRQN